jgi:polysaccharide pyruvyl transferase CsaB
VSGYYGCGNAGDEAVLAGIHEAFRRQAGERVELTAFSQHPEQTTALHGIRAADRMNLWTLRTVLKASSLLLSGGGSLLQDTTSVRSLLYYLWVARIAYSMRVPYMFYAQGIGPLSRPLSRWLVRLVANHAASITVRDEPSAKLLASIGVHNTAIEVTADPAFALSPAPQAVVDACWQEEGLPQNNRPKIGVALRPWGQANEARTQNYARLLTELEAQTGAQVILIPMQVPGDVTFSEEVVRQTGQPHAFPIVRHAYPPETLLGLIARMDSIVAMRLHTLIFAASVAVPPYALSYDPKVSNLMELLELGGSLEHWEGFQPEEVAAELKQQLQEREARSQALARKAIALEKRALRNADIALTLL